MRFLPKRHVACVGLALFLAAHVLYFAASNYVNSSNDGSHYALVNALAQEGTVKIDHFVKLTGFLDYNAKGGAYYSDRPPGTALLAVPFYRLGYEIRQLGWNFLQANPRSTLVVFTLLLPQLMGASAVVLLFLLGMRLTGAILPAAVTALLYGLTTLNALEATQLKSHSTSAALMLAAAYLATLLPSSKGRNLLAGTVGMFLLLGWAAITEIQNVLVVPIFVGYWLYGRRQRAHGSLAGALAAGLGAFACVYLILIAYNYAAFGELTIKSNRYNPLWPAEHGLTSALHGSLSLGFKNLFFRFYGDPFVMDTGTGRKIVDAVPGHFVVSPILIACLPGFWPFFRRQRAEALLCLGVVAPLVAVAAMHRTPLPRHISTVLPFVFLPLVYVLQGLGAWWQTGRRRLVSGAWALLTVLAAASAWGVLQQNVAIAQSLRMAPFHYLTEWRALVIFYGLALGVVLMVRAWRKPTYRRAGRPIAKR